MKPVHRILPRASLVMVLVLFVARSADAGGLAGYVGPGAGLGMLGALFAVACVILLALLGPILYPIRAFLAWRRRCRERTTASEVAASKVP